jgi:hypothetical protein
MTSYGAHLICDTLNGATPGTFTNPQDLADVLATGNDALGASIDNVNNLKVTSLTEVSTLNGQNVNQFLSPQNLADVLTVGNSAGSANIEGVNFYKGSNMDLIGEAKASQLNGTILLVTDSIDARFSSCVSTILLPNLPTADPFVANQLWVDSGRHVKISAGGA